MANITLEKFTAEQRAIIDELDLTQLPRHIAVIMDGNGRWATQQGLPRVIGHRAGTESVRRVVRACQDLDIGYLTLYSFSTENWARPSEEVAALMGLIEQQLRMEVAHLHGEGVRVRHLGRKDNLPASLQQALCEAEEMTANNPSLTLSLAVNYSGRAELCDAARKVAARVAAGELDAASITEDDLARALCLPDIPDPDLLVRTAGEMRISNYLLWQIAYAELWVTPVLWPEFGVTELLQAFHAYQLRQRKFGRVLS